MLVGSRRTRKTRHSKRACHRTRHSRGTWKRTETFTYHGKRWSKPYIYIYIPIQHRSINRANTDKREIFHWSFADFTFPEENLCRYRKWRQLSRGSPPLFKLFPATVRLEPNFTPLQRYTNDIYIFLSKIIWSWPSDYSSHAFTWETWTFHSMGQLYNIQRRVICLAGMRLATLLESAAFPRGWRRSDRLRWDERVPWFLEGRVSNE